MKDELAGKYYSRHEYKLVTQHMVGLDPHTAVIMLDLMDTMSREIAANASRPHITRKLIDLVMPIIATHLVCKFGDDIDAKLAFITASLVIVNLEAPMYMAIKHSSKQNGSDELYHVAESVLATASSIMRDYLAGDEEAVKLIKDRLETPEQYDEQIGGFVSKISANSQEINAFVEQLVSHNTAAFAVK